MGKTESVHIIVKRELSVRYGENWVGAYYCKAGAECALWGKLCRCILL